MNIWKDSMVERLRCCPYCGTSFADISEAVDGCFDCPNCKEYIDFVPVIPSSPEPYKKLKIEKNSGTISSNLLKIFFRRRFA